MQKIMFDHRRFGLEQAVLELLKTMTLRGAKLPDGLEANDVWNPVMGIDDKGKVYFTVDCIDGKQCDLYPQYQVGEVVNPTRLAPCRWPWLYRLLGYRLTLAYDLWHLRRCTHIFMMAGAEYSTGARLERRKAHEWGISIHNYMNPI